jgi:hypothetical protein
MNHAKQWTVIIDIDEHESSTRAVARLLTRDSDRLAAFGSARRAPDDRDVPQIGDELAVSRALAALARKLHATADADIAAEAVPDAATT